MRTLIVVFTLIASLLAVPAAFAAPTCQDINGSTIRCGTPGAMPVGWTLSPEQLLARQSAGPQYPSTIELLELFCVMGVFFAVMALMPEFDGRRAGDWDRQEGDPEERRKW
ncbi:MAG TPA: hypothetical protein VHT51_11225 [Micropepsaceae bacterium]|jgi:hypothetical protein|nr:hypothetical protein [Micropepsaceae bacterium]